MKRLPSYTALAGASLMMLAACGTNSDEQAGTLATEGQAAVNATGLPAADPAPDDARFPLPTHGNPDVGADAQDAEGKGILRGNPETACVWFESPETRELTPVVFPLGYTAEWEPLRILDASGKVVAEEGDDIRTGGGYANESQSTAYALPPECAQGDIPFVVQRPLEQADRALDAVDDSDPVDDAG